MSQAAGAHVARRGALADLAGQHPGEDVARLPRPVGEPADERRRLVTARVSAEGRVVALRQYACPLTPPVGHAQAVRLTMIH